MDDALNDKNDKHTNKNIHGHNKFDTPKSVKSFKFDSKRNSIDSSSVRGYTPPALLS